MERFWAYKNRYCAEKVLLVLYGFRLLCVTNCVFHDFFIPNPNQLWNCSARPVCATVTLFLRFSELWSDLYGCTSKANSCNLKFKTSLYFGTWSLLGKQFSITKIGMYFSTEFMLVYFYHKKSLFLTFPACF